MSSSSKIPNIEPYYNYKPLAEGSIRLLRIRVPDTGGSFYSTADFEEEVHVTLEEYPLESCPTFIALSYTWGEPTVIEDPTLSIFTSVPRCYPIYCEGKLLRGTRNLRDALRRIRQNTWLRTRTNYKQTEFEGRALGAIERYWIDALCVDQDDLSERAIQVQLMSKIYGQASSCMAYLGEEDKYSKLALKVIGAFFIDEEIASYLVFGEHDKAGERAIRRMTALPGKQKNALRALLSRRYFGRLWILQEIILAKVIAGVLGSVIFDFQYLFYLGGLVANAEMDLSILRLDIFAVGRKRFSWGQDSVQGRQPVPYLAAVNLGALGRARARIKHGLPIHFYDVAVMTQACSTSDERDRIYGVLAISDEFSDITIDYHLPVHRVYTSATVSFGLRRDHLEFLCFVGEHKTMKIKSLPSWCPDYSTDYASIRILDDRDDWHVGSFWKSSPDVKFEDNQILIASGVRYDVLSGTAVTTNQVIESSTVVQCAKPSALLKLALNLPGKHPENTSNEKVTRIEKLWRLLFMDIFLDRRPAPPATALFLPQVVVEIFRTHFKLPDSSLSSGSGQPSSEVGEEVDALGRVIDEICCKEPESSPFLPYVPEIKECMMRRSVSGAHQILLHSLRQRAIKAGLSSDLDDMLPPKNGPRDTDADINSWMTWWQNEFSPTMRAPLLAKSFFSTTRTAQLGIGYSSIEVGDEVWLLNGHHMPVVLGQLQSGHYRFLGEAYVPGIMHGERVEELRAFPVQRIRIE